MNRAGRARIDASIVIPFIIFTAIWGSTWIVIRDQIGSVPTVWSVAYRFVIAAVAMACVARWQGFRLAPSRGLLGSAAFLGIAQFSANFSCVYQAEHYVTSGLVATVFALLLIPNSLLAWTYLGQRPGRAFLVGGAVAVAGVGLLFAHELGAAPGRGAAVMTGLAWTLAGLMGASMANVFQAGERARRYALPVLLAWSMAFGALADVALAASVLCFSLYFPVVRKIGPGRAAYSSVIVPIIAMAISTVVEGYRWTPLAAAGAALAIGGMLVALVWRRPLPAAAPDAG